MDYKWSVLNNLL